MILVSRRLGLGAHQLTRPTGHERGDERAAQEGRVGQDRESESHVTFRGDAPPGAKMVYDVIVVGGGSAGCVLASQLSEDAHRAVLLVEAGPDYPTVGDLPADIADAR